MDEGRWRTSFPGLDGMRDRRRALIDELVAARRAAGLSHTEIAARMGTSQSAVARLNEATSTPGCPPWNATPPR